MHSPAPASAFRRLPSPEPRSEAEIRFSFEGAEVAARAGDSVAAALLAAGVMQFRETPVSGAPRAPWCMIGVCFDCLVEIDGVASRQACLTTVAPGMRVRRQRRAPTVAGEEG